jgi:hypothetical protein
MAAEMRFLRSTEGKSKTERIRNINMRESKDKHYGRQLTDN